MFQRVRARGFTSGLACFLTLAACRDAPVPPYVRMTGPAPPLADVPASRAFLVVFWASWCAPCRDETPSLRKLADDAPRDLAIVVFTHDEALADARAFFGGTPPDSWRLRADRDKAMAKAFGVDTLPASFVVVDGRLKARFSGPRDWNSVGMRRLLKRLIAERAR